MDLEDFLADYPLDSNSIPFTPEELEGIRGNIPPDIREFLKTYGRCSFGEGFLRTILPTEIDSKTIFKAWGLKKGDYHIFMTTCFGACFYFNKTDYFMLEPLTGEYAPLSEWLDSTLNQYLTMGGMKRAILHKFYQDRKKDLPGIKANEIHMFVPTLVLGGSMETSKLETGKIFEHLCILADLFGNKAGKF